MLDFDKFKGSLPYQESPAYVSDLVGKCREQALSSGKATPERVIRPWIWGVAAAAALALMLTLGITLIPRKSPIDSFLANVSDEEVALIVNLNIDDIPEYDINDNE